MPLDLVKQFEKHEKAISRYVDDRISTYFGSTCFKVLKNRYARLRDSIDMRYHETRSGGRAINDWKSKIAIPLVREVYLMRRSVIHAAYAKDPLISVVPTIASTEEGARLMQDTLQSNIRSTKFREGPYRQIVNSCSRYGSAVGVHYFRGSSTESMVTQRRMVAGVALGYERQPKPRYRKGVYLDEVHILNYFQNPNIINPRDSDYQGYIGREHLSAVMAEFEADPALYVKKNMKKILDEAERGGRNDPNYYTANKAEDPHAVGLDIQYWWGTLNIKGNEDDETEYYIERIGDTIVRIEENPNDWDIRPLTTWGIDQREEWWWSNTDSEGVVPHENYLNLLFGMAADNGLRALQNYIMYPRGLVDVADINNRAKNGGWVPFDMTQLKPGMGAKDLFYRYEFPEASMQNADWIAAQVKEAASRLKTKGDMNRKATQGGPVNDTATAAIYMNEQGDVQENFYLNEFSVGMKDMGEKQSIILQQRLGDRIRIRPRPDAAPLEFEKWQMLGEYGYYIETSLTRNQQIRLMNLQNAITAMVNFKGTGDPTWQRVNMEDVVRQWFRELELGIEVDRMLPPAPPEQAMPVPGLQAGQVTIPQGAPMQPPAMAGVSGPQPSQMQAAA
jgi:hypothetical protein